jgi:hypothetical protein
MKCDFVGTYPKDAIEIECNEDKYAISESESVVALSDGASESYDSRLWATMLVEKYVLDPCLTSDWVKHASDAYAALHDSAGMTWSKQAAFERGSFATLLGITHNVDTNTVEILAVGDCIAFLVSDGRLVDSWPFIDPEFFKQRPTLLSTLNVLNNFVSEPTFLVSRTHSFNLAGLNSPKVFCMSDAIGEWALRLALEESNVSNWDELLSAEGLERIVVEQRKLKRMRVDDSTLIALSF